MAEEKYPHIFKILNEMAAVERCEGKSLSELTTDINKFVSSVKDLEKSVREFLIS